jgi:hypothetical protein
MLQVLCAVTGCRPGAEPSGCCRLNPSKPLRLEQPRPRQAAQHTINAAPRQQAASGPATRALYTGYQASQECAICGKQRHES